MLKKILIIVILIFVSISLWQAFSIAAVKNKPKLESLNIIQKSRITKQLGVLCKERNEFCELKITYKSVKTPWYARLWYIINNEGGIYKGRIVASNDNSRWAYIQLTDVLLEDDAGVLMTLYHELSHFKQSKPQDYNGGYDECMNHNYIKRQTRSFGNSIKEKYTASKDSKGIQYFIDHEGNQEISCNALIKQ